MSLVSSVAAPYFARDVALLRYLLGVFKSQHPGAHPALIVRIDDSFAKPSAALLTGPTHERLGDPPRVAPSEIADPASSILYSITYRLGPLLYGNLKDSHRDELRNEYGNVFAWRHEPDSWMSQFQLSAPLVLSGGHPGNHHMFETDWACVEAFAESNRHLTGSQAHVQGMRALVALVYLRIAVHELASVSHHTG